MWLGHEATQTAPKPTAIPLVPVPAFAVLSAAPVTGSTYTWPLSPAPTHTADLSRAIAATNVPA